MNLGQQQWGAQSFLGGRGGAYPFPSVILDQVAELLPLSF